MTSKKNFGVILNDYRTSESIGEGVILYGEIYGAGIQKNYEYGLTDIQFAGFDLKIERRVSRTLVELIYNWK
jgi:hypothetical protein